MKCVSCKNETEPVCPGHGYDTQISEGLYFKIFGGYGEFFESTPNGENQLTEEPLEVLLCHDCSVKVMEIVDPDVTQWGGHYTLLDNNERCCKWCWTKEDVQNKTNERID